MYSISNVDNRTVNVCKLDKLWMHITTTRWYDSPSSESSSALVVIWTLLLGNARRWLPHPSPPSTTWTRSRDEPRLKGRDLGMLSVPVTECRLTSSLTSSLSALNSTARLRSSPSVAVTRQLLSIYLSIYLSIHPSIHLCIYLFIYRRRFRRPIRGLYIFILLRVEYVIMSGVKLGSRWICAPPSPLIWDPTQLVQDPAATLFGSFSLRSLCGFIWCFFT